MAFGDAGKVPPKGSSPLPLPGVTDEVTEVTQIKAALARIRYQGKAGWSVAVVVLLSTGAEATAVGNFLTVKPGDTLLLTGKWVVDPKWGQQFKVQDGGTKVLVPGDDEGLIGFLASRMPEVGRNRATALVERFGQGVFDIIEKSPERLAEVPGITLDRVPAIVAAYNRERAQRDVLVELKRLGLTDWAIDTLTEKYGWTAGEEDLLTGMPLPGVIPALKENPYRLFEDVDGFGWEKTDALAQRLGVGKDSVARARAAALYMLSEARGMGHTFARRGKLIAEMMKAAEGLSAQSATLGVAGIVVDGLVVEEKRGDEERVYLTGLYVAEETCAAELERLIKGS